MCVLAGDIGGTKTVLALFERGEDGAPRKLQAERFASRDFGGLAPIAHSFLGKVAGNKHKVAAATFGIAGPIKDNSCRATNLPWVVDGEQLVEGTGIPHVELLNDFHAAALGVTQLTSEDLSVLQPGSVDPAGPIGVLGAGTGLGEAFVLPTPLGPKAVATEGGHADFAPRDELEMHLLRFLLRRYSRVSVERVVSGPGLANLYDFVVTERLATTRAEVAEAVRGQDAGEVIGREALAGTDHACARAVDLFVSLYGAEAGNLALKLLPTGGLYVAGGIAPKLLPKLRQGAFLHSFLSKGRMAPLLQNFRVCVVLNQELGLIGAATRALNLAGGQPGAAPAPL